MKRFKKAAAALLALVTAAQLYACGRPDTETTAAETPSDITETDPAETTGTVTEEKKPLTVNEADGKASVNVNGVSYEAEGYKRFTEGKFRFSDGFRITFDGVTGKFNRMVFSYSSSQPLSIDVVYVENNSEKTAQYYVEAAENGVFGCLIKSYLDAGLATSLVSISARSCSKNVTEFILEDVSLEELPLINKTTYYIENDRFKVGVNLAWGGGINYIEDKTCKIKNLTNLVNKHDTGRLIQQSYYGTAGNDEYQPEMSMGSMWVYNPVQGGDQYNNPSRLIDLRVTDNSVYIKAQPLDWSKKNYLTPSYMENTYTVGGEYIRVDNRFIDFSGWEHRNASQELPALYTVSYLSRFTWYDGVNSWEDDTLSYKDDLNFWGSAEYVNDCTMKMKVNNTETWCAWVNPDDDFGLGIYVPNVDVFKAGRYEYDGSKRAQDNPTNYVAPLNIIKIVSFTPIEYSYLMTTGSVSQIRATFKANKDFSDNASLHVNYTPNRVYGGTKEMVDASFENEYDVAMISGINSTDISYSSEYKAAVLTVNGGDPYVSFDYTGAAHDASEYKTLTIEYMIPKDNAAGSYQTDLFLCTGEQKYADGNKRTRQDLVKDGEFHTLTVDISKFSYWKGVINLIRFDFFDNCAPGDVMYLRSFKLS